MKITPKTKLKDLMENEKAIGILFESGLHCIGCGMAMYETLEQGCLAHGMNKKQIDELIKKLNNQTQGKIKRRKPEVSSQ
jgi:hybrid cluster-associated redox disulfide protein